MSPVEESMLILDARSAGHYEVVAGDDDLVLHSRTSLQLWDSLLAILESVLTGEAETSGMA